MISGLVNDFVGRNFPCAPLNNHRLQALLTCVLSVESMSDASLNVQLVFLVSWIYPKTVYACPTIFAASCLVRKSVGL